MHPAMNGHAGHAAASTAAGEVAIAPAEGVDGSDWIPVAGDRQDGRGAPHHSGTGLTSQLASNTAATVDDRDADAGRSAAGGIDAHMPINFRVVTEPIGLQPASMLYGVPYDLVDQSNGSALAELMRLTK